MSSHSAPETIRSNGCGLTVRRFNGREACEVFLSCEPAEVLGQAEAQAEASYRAILELLESEGCSFECVVSETLYLRDVARDLVGVRRGRERALSAGGHSGKEHSLTEIEQPPLDDGACFAVAIQVLIPLSGDLARKIVCDEPACECPECSLACGLAVELGEETRFLAGSLCGSGQGAYAQTLNMFEVAEGLLAKAGMDFADVVRTWIHLGEMERDYSDLNRARRVFFESRGISPVPASTGIGGKPVSSMHDLSLGIYAIKADSPPNRTVMTSPTLNEAGTYGADFVRGMAVEEVNRIALHVSGTASINEAGQTVHVGDFEGQADRMLVNIAALLEGQGASFGDVVSAVTYVKRAEDGAGLRGKFREAGFEGFPNVFVTVPVCRPELLCEVEVLALRAL